VRNKAVYLAIGVDVEGRKQVLGLWMGDGGEGSKFWLHVLTEIKNRGTVDVLIVCCDGLNGLPDAIETTWPQAIVQTCVVHLLRGSFRFASYKDRKAIAKALRPIYTAVNEAAALDALDTFELEWGDRYPGIVKLWRSSWERFTPFLAYPAELRTVVYTTDEIVNPLSWASLAASRRRGARRRVRLVRRRPARRLVVA
jgi:putative transposase